MAIVAFPYRLTTSSQRTFLRNVSTDYAMDGTPWSRIMGSTRARLNCTVSGLINTDIDILRAFFDDNKMNLIAIRHSNITYNCQIIGDITVVPDGGSLYSVTFQAVESPETL